VVIILMLRKAEWLQSLCYVKLSRYHPYVT